MFLSRFVRRSLVKPCAGIAVGSFRACSTEVVAATSRIPSNLILADESVLEDPPEPIIPEIEYFFPRHPKDVPTSTPIVKFAEPGSVSSEASPLDQKVFGVAYRSDIINSVVKYLRHKRRQPKKTKRISDISGSGKKPHPQKRQGRAQAGHKRSSLRRHGQKAHGPKLRDYSIDMPKKVRALGMMMALSAKHREGNLVVVDSLDIESPRTAPLVDRLAEHGITEDKNTLVADCYDVAMDEDNAFNRAARNVPWLLSLPQSRLDVYNMMQKPRLVITAAAFEELQTRVRNQYFATGRRVKYANLLAEYNDLVGEQEAPRQSAQYELAK